MFLNDKVLNNASMISAPGNSPVLDDEVSQSVQDDSFGDESMLEKKPGFSYTAQGLNAHGLLPHPAAAQIATTAVAPASSEPSSAPTPLM